MKVVADCFQMLGTVRTHWTWCSLIWGWWRARQAKARSLMYLMASVTTRSAETFLPIASSIWRSMVIFWNWKKNLYGNCACYLFKSNGALKPWFLLVFYYFEKILSTIRKTHTGRRKNAYWFQSLCVKNHQVLMNAPCSCSDSKHIKAKKQINH